MGMRAELIKKQAPEVRKIFYNDGYHCKDVETYTFNRYIADNADNVKVLEDAVTDGGITLVVAPTGSGKSRTLNDVAKSIVKKDRGCKVFIALPTVALTEQVGNTPGIRAMPGGKRFYPDERITATTYEKLADVQDYIRKQKALGSRERYVLILDECHFLVTQHKFRELAMKGIINSIESHFYDSAVLVTATPAPMPLFRCDRCIEFESDTYKPVMDRIEIEFVDDVVEYIKRIDLKQCFPFIRLNHKDTIAELADKSLPTCAVLTGNRKDMDIYGEIVSQESVSNGKYQGILTTSFSEVGINVTSYPADMQMIAAFPDWNMSVDSIEQFFNRARRTDTSHIECAKIILPRAKVNEASLLDGDGNELCQFHDIMLDTDIAEIADTSQMDGLADGSYKVELRLYGGKYTRTLEIQSFGKSRKNVYCKDSQPVTFYGVGFRSFLNILKSDYKAVNRVKDTLQFYVDAFKKARDARQAAGSLTEDEMQDLVLDENRLIEIMTVSGIEAQKELGACLSYKDGEIQVDKRTLYMVSYNKFQRQYLYHADKLKEELEARMKVKVDFVETATGKGKKDYNRDDLWEGIEKTREEVVCNDDYYGALVKHQDTFYKWSIDHRDNISAIRERDYLMEMMGDLEKLKMPGRNILRVMTSSKTKAKVTNYKNAHILIAGNRVLERLDVVDAGEIPLYSRSIKDQMQVAIYCCLKQKGQTCYKITERFLQEIISFYKKAFPSDMKVPTEKQIKRKLKKMYKSKGKDTIRNELRTNEEDIFELVEPDYK